jgi:hypothetical protein
MGSRSPQPTHVRERPVATLGSAALGSETLGADALGSETLDSTPIRTASLGSATLDPSEGAASRCERTGAFACAAGRAVRRVMGCGASCSVRRSARFGDSQRRGVSSVEGSATS